MDRWNDDSSISKDDLVKDVRTRVLHCMKAGLVYPYTTFYSLQQSDVLAYRGNDDTPL